MNPYSVLGISSDASEQEIKKAYHTLVKKNHPDRFTDENEKKEATKRLAKINEAYDMITKKTTNNASYSSYTGENSEVFARIRQYISMNDIMSAQSILNTIQNKNAQWHYLQGVVFLRQGFYDNARRHLEIAYNMEPSNSEYANAYNSINNKATNFYNPFGNTNFKQVNLNSCCLSSCCLAGLSSWCCMDFFMGLFRCCW